MSTSIAAVGSLVTLIALSSCSVGPEGASGGVVITAQRDLKVSDTPLGDVIVEELEQGERVTALCLILLAQSSAGSVGSAIKVRWGSRTGYAAITDFPVDPADRQLVFNLDLESLQGALPICPD